MKYKDLKFGCVFFGPPGIVYADLECLLEKTSFGLEFLFEKISPYRNNFEKS